MNFWQTKDVNFNCIYLRCFHIDGIGEYEDLINLSSFAIKNQCQQNCCGRIGISRNKIKAVGHAKNRMIIFQNQIAEFY